MADNIQHEEAKKLILMCAYDYRMMEWMGRSLNLADLSYLTQQSRSVQSSSSSYKYKMQYLTRYSNWKHWSISHVQMTSH